MLNQKGPSERMRLERAFTLLENAWAELDKAGDYTDMILLINKVLGAIEDRLED